MQKIKNAVYEHRFGLFFFCFLMLYSFVVSGDMRVWEVDDVTFSFHVVDFSIGFCTKLLPGAVCNLLFSEPSREQVSVYLTILIFICYFFLGMLLEKAFSKIEKENKAFYFILIMFFITGPATFAIYTDMFCWLDFYWMFAAVMSVFCLQNRYTYFLVVPLMVAAVMTHFASILCYVPFIAIYMLYKISVTEKRRERVHLWIIWWILVVCTIGLSLYMAAYEVENVNMTMEEMDALLLERGVHSSRYYDFAFFRDEVVDKMPEYFEAEDVGVVLNIDMNQPGLGILIDMIIQQISINMNKSSLVEDIKHFIMLNPVLAYIYRTLYVIFRNSKKNLLKRFSVFCSAALFFVSLFFGLLFSTDTIRWISHAFAPLFAFVIYAFIKESDEVKTEIKGILKNIPVTAIVCYFMVYSISINLF